MTLPLRTELDGRTASPFTTFDGSQRALRGGARRGVVRARRRTTRQFVALAVHRARDAAATARLPRRLDRGFAGGERGADGRRRRAPQRLAAGADAGLPEGPLGRPRGGPAAEWRGGPSAPAQSADHARH